MFFDNLKICTLSVHLHTLKVLQLSIYIETFSFKLKVVVTLLGDLNMCTLKEINLIHTSKESAEAEKKKLSVSTPTYVYEIDGHDAQKWFVIERHSTYAIGQLYQKKYNIKCDGVSTPKVTKDDVVEFMKGLSKEEIKKLLGE